MHECRTRACIKFSSKKKKNIEGGWKKINGICNLSLKIYKSNREWSTGDSAMLFSLNHGYPICKFFFPRTQHDRIGNIRLKDL